MPELAQSCSEETSSFLKGRGTDGRYCLELFRRAVIRRDDDAWACLYRQYAPLVLTWVLQHQSAAPLLAEEGAASLVNAAFAKFAHALTPAKMEGFEQLSAVLKYLKLCARSVVADAQRTRQARPLEEPLEVGAHERAGDDPAEGVVATLAAQRLWQLIAQELHGEDERLLLYCSLLLDMKPSEIAEQYPGLFPSVEDVYRIRRNALERLQRNQRLRVAAGYAPEEQRLAAPLMRHTRSDCQARQPHEQHG
jgi:RNA polymerase sigma factor (sigma-70 family)